MTSRSVVETGLELDSRPGRGAGAGLPALPLAGQGRGRGPRAGRASSDRRPRSGPDVGEALDELTLTISREFTYDRAVTDVYSAVDEVLALRAGVCQDFAHLFIAAARAMGVPARYVSGYIHSPAGGGASSASHAWAEGWVPGRGWVGFDATHPVRTSEHHVRLAVGRDYSDAAPTRGIYVGSATGTMAVTVRTRSVD